MAVSVALDLGTTRIKGAVLLKDGSLDRVVSLAAPPLTRSDPVHEGDPIAYLRVAERVLEETRAGLPGDLPVGIASQRSTFVVWDQGSGAPVTPMISWLDRRAVDWCDRHVEREPDVSRRTGLRLSPHYAGPKLAAMIERDEELGSRMRQGRLRFGNLDSWALRSWAATPAHETDLGMAARTLLVDIASAAWSEPMLELFAVPRELLPEIRPTRGRRIRLRSGAVVTATAADQAAALLAAVGAETEAILVNLGTGGFALRLEERDRCAPDGFLLGPVVGGAGSGGVYAVEGTIPGIAIAMERCGPGPSTFPGHDPAPDAFCLPDCAGLGAPHWRPRVPQTFSPAALRLAPLDRRRIVLEGILFRARELVEGMSSARAARTVRLTGGLAHEPGLPGALAACLGRPVELLADVEASLLGAAQLAAARTTWPAPPCTTIAPSAAAGYLERKFERYREWLRTEVLFPSTSIPPDARQAPPRCGP